MKLRILLFLSVVFICVSCKKNNEDGFYTATVLPANTDCGAVINTLIQTDRPIAEISASATMFNASNLPAEYRVPGKRLKIKAVSAPNEGQICLALYMSYLHIQITAIK